MINNSQTQIGSATTTSGQFHPSSVRNNSKQARSLFCVQGKVQKSALKPQRGYFASFLCRFLWLFMIVRPLESLESNAVLSVVSDLTLRSIDWLSPVSSLVVQLRPPTWDQSRGDRGGPEMLPCSFGSQVIESPEIFLSHRVPATGSPSSRADRGNISIQRY